MPTKVLIIDDSALVRNLLKEVFAKDPSIEVVGSAPDPFVARDKIIKYNPDVITLDVEMPRMDGITFLKKLMRYYPIPVIILSSLTQKGALTTLEAMEEGAVEVIAKPSLDITKGIEVISRDIIEKVKGAAAAKVRKRVEEEKSEKPRVIERIRERTALTQSTHKIIAIGASTGGTEAVRFVLERMPPTAPGILIVQHMPEKFTKAFAERLDGLCAVNVKEAKDGDAVIQGTALIAPGNYHMQLRRDGARYYVKLDQGERVFHQRPSVDVLFDSVAKYAGRNAVGAVLTGMGADGAAGLLKMRQAGARTMAQDEESCVVFGMPKEAIKLGGAEKIVALGNVTDELLKFAALLDKEAAV
ncbi:MAG: chemotaxis response regulator protein-glutamate methylesterase [Deltaproteobacteria bacterium]|nr:chemotaxis response regulator protein-glutamate methylesterase [Deltaproteobacteria bacterium]